MGEHLDPADLSNAQRQRVRNWLSVIEAARLLELVDRGAPAHASGAKVLVPPREILDRGIHAAVAHDVELRLTQSKAIAVELISQRPLRNHLPMVVAKFSVRH